MDNIITEEEFIEKSTIESVKLCNGESCISLYKGGEVRNYQIVRSRFELSLFLNNKNKPKSEFILSSENFYEYAIALFNLELNDSFDFECISNVIFLRIVSIKCEGGVLNFNNCSFKSVVFYDSECRMRSSRFDSSFFYDRIVIEGEVVNFDVSNCVFKGSSFFFFKNAFCKRVLLGHCDIKIILSHSSFDYFEIVNSNVVSLTAEDTDVARKFFIYNSDLLSGGLFKLKNFSTSGYGRISLNSVHGDLFLDKCNLSSMYFDFSELLGDNFCKFIDDRVDYSTSISTLSCLRDIAVSMGDTKLALNAEFYENMFKRKSYLLKCGLVDKVFKYPFYLFAEILTAYFCKWERFLYSIFFVIVCFSCLYFYNSEYILHNGKPVFDGSVHEYLLYGKAGLEVISEVFFECLYFSIITFVTIGYGDYSPDPSSSFKLLPGLEGIIGVILISFLTVSIVRRFTK